HRHSHGDAVHHSPHPEPPDHTRTTPSATEPPGPVATLRDAGQLLRELADISETVLLYHGDRGRPRAHRMLTETSPVQDKLAGIFSLARYAPRR
ncbi:MAG: hypothetical protein ACRDOL_42200, partial [Streptosporangiaceae bacterium]